jgi:hypothetical protein
MLDQILIWEVARLIAAPIARAMHDPLKIFKAAQILSDAIVFAGLTALATSIIASLCTICVTVNFTHYLKRLDAKKLGLALLCLVPLGLSGCGGGESEDCYWWHRHRHPHHWRADDNKSEIAAPAPVKLAAMPSVDEPATPEIVAKPAEHFGGITVMTELREMKEYINKLANRPVVCLCECSRRPFRDATKGPGPVMFWRVDPMNPSLIQYGYEMGGFFYVLSSAPRPVGFEPPK